MRAAPNARTSAARGFVPLAAIAILFLTASSLPSAPPANATPHKAGAPLRNGETIALVSEQTPIVADTLTERYSGGALAESEADLRLSDRLEEDPGVESSGVTVQDSSTCDPSAHRPPPTGTSYNISREDNGPHRINEVSMIVTPTGTRLGRNIADMGFCAFMRYPAPRPQSNDDDRPYTIVVSRGQFGRTWRIAYPLIPQTPVAFNNTGDPVLASNPSLTGSFAERVYLAGTTFVHDASGDHENQITVWHLDPYTVDAQWEVETALGFNPITNTTAGTTDYFDDKPAIAVSQHQNSLGYVYVAYLAIGSDKEVIIRFVRNGGADHWLETPLYSSKVTNENIHAIQGTRLDIDQSTGVIYLSWLDWTDGKVNVMVSADHGVNWTSHKALDGEALFTDKTPALRNGGTAGVNAKSLLASTFNTTDHSLALVYHRNRGGVSEVVMRRFTSSDGSFSEPKIISGLNDSTTPPCHDVQWQGAVACGIDGSCVVTYYDNYIYDYDMKYKVYARRVNSDGSAIVGEKDIQLKFLDTKETAIELSDPSKFISNRMEYQDAFYRAGKWYTASVVVNTWYSPNGDNTSNSDVYVTRSDSHHANRFIVSGPSTIQRGDVVPITITALDANGTPITDYIEQVAFSSSDNTAILPDVYTFVPADAGTHTFNVTFQTAGVQTFTASELGPETAASSSSSTTVTTQQCPTLILNLLISPNDTHIPTSTITLFAAGVGTNLTYQWYKGAVGDLSTPLAQGSSYSGVILTSGAYWVRATDACGQTADAGTFLYSCKPAITGNPQGGVVGPGHPRQLTVTATPAHPEQVLTYQWYVGNPPSPIADAASRTYTATQGGTYFATVSAPCEDGLQARVASAPAEVTACGPPTISPLADRDVDRAIPHTLQVNATGTDLTYQWYIGAAGVISNPVPDGTAASITVQPSDSTDYWVRVTDQGVCSADSNTAHITVCTPPTITANPGGSDVFSGSSVTLTVAARPNSQAPLHYTWIEVDVNGNGVPVPGNDSNSFTTPALTASKTWFVRVFSGSLLSAYTDSARATVHVCDLPEVHWAVFPHGLRVGEQFTLLIMEPPAGTDLYWYRGVSGDVAHSTLLTSVPGHVYYYFQLLPATTTASYWVRVQQGTCFIDSSTLILPVCVATITRQPAGAAITAGGSTTLSAAATPADLTYQWFIGETGDVSQPAANGTAASCTVSPAVDTRYWVRISGSCGQPADSDSVLVTVCQLPHITQNPQSTDIRRGMGANLGIFATGSNLTYQWYAGTGTSNPMQTTSSISVTPAVTATYWVRVSGACGTSQDSALATVRVCTTPAITAQPQSVTIFGGAATTLSVAATEDGVEPMQYQWYGGASGDTSAPVSGATGASFTTPALTQTTGYWVRVTCGVCNPIDSAAATVSICNYPQVLSAPADQFIAVGQTATLNTFVATGNAYQWYVGASGNTSQLALDGPSNLSSFTAAPAATRQYWVQITNGGCVSRTQSATVYVCVPLITQDPASTMISSGNSTVLTVTASSAVTYQWYRGASGDTSAPVGTNSASFTTPPLTAATSYWVRVTGSCTRWADSATATVTMCVQPAIVSVTPTQSIIRGSNTTCLVNAAGTNLTYQWYVGASGNTAVPVNGATSSAITVTPQNTTSYWLRVTGQCGIADSPTSTVRVCTTPVITAQPQGVTIFSGGTTTLSVTATENGIEPMQYQWYRGAAGDTSAAVSGATGASFTTPALTAPTSYWVRVICSVCNPADSQAATVSICSYPQTLSAPADQFIAVGQTATLITYAASGNTYQWYVGASGNTTVPAPGPSNLSSYSATPSATTQYWVQIANAGCISRTQSATVYICVPTITQQPASIMINAGTSTTLTVAANTSGLTYQWYAGTSGTTASPLSGQTGASLTVSPSATTNYWVRVTGSCSRSTDSATATVTICTPTAIYSVTPTQSIVRGSNTSCLVNVTGSNLTYQWYVGTSGNTAFPIYGATSSMITVTPQDPTSYWVRVSGSCGSVNSANMLVNVCAVPAITAQPQGTIIFSGGTATLSVTASEATTQAISFQWYRGATGDVSAPVGTNSTSFTTPALTAATSYWVRVTCGICNPADSAAATISICNYPQVLSAPVDQFIALGQTATLATYIGNAYQWYVGASGNTAVPAPGGSNLSSYTMAPNVTTQYWAQITYGGCVSRTQSATVYVCVPTFTQQPASITITPGTSTTLTAAANTAGVTYQWYNGASGNTGSPIGGATGTSMTVTPATDSSYWMRATGSCGRTTDSVTATVTLCSPPAITYQPHNASPVYYNGTSGFTVQTTGSNLTYQWYYGESGDTSQPVNGATDSSVMVAGGTFKVWVRVTGQCGAVNSSAAWASRYPTINWQPPAELTVGYNATASISFGAQGSNIFNWRNGNGALIATTTTPSLITPPITSDTYIHCEIVSGAAVTSTWETHLAVCYNGPYIYSISKGGGTSCNNVFANTTAADNYEWYQGASGDTSHPLGSGGSVIYVCPSGPTQYWFRAITWSSYNVVSCYSDSPAITMP